MSTVTMQELELETAELLPARETLTTATRGPTAAPPSDSYDVNNQIGLVNFNNSFNNNGIFVGSASTCRLAPLACRAFA